MAEAENVLIQKVILRAGQCAVTVLPQFGGKIASIHIGECELMQPPLVPIAERTRTMGFDEADASGWDECLPSVAACRVDTGHGVAEIPDHGDLWRVEWKKRSAGDIGPGETSHGEPDAVSSFVGRCFTMPLELERKMELTENESGWRLVLNYRLRNQGRFPVPWSWAAHPLFTAEKGDRILLPESIRTVRLEGSGRTRLGKRGDTVAWPLATLADGSRTDLSVAAGPDSRIADKLFAGPLRAYENWCALERPSRGLRIRVKFDSASTPYVGLWICYGGWPARPGPKQVCVAIEPSTSPVDSLAETGLWARALAPGESFSWPMEMEIDRLER